MLYLKYTGDEKMSTTTHQVNFRAESSLYKQAKSTLDTNKVSMSDISSDTVDDDTFRTAFADLKKEILVGHQAILEGNTTSLADVRKEFNLD